MKTKKKAETTPSQRRPRRKGDKLWQEEKSEQTRKAILEAAIECFIDLGYARTTTWSIAKRASVSRGAMTHHFPARADVIEAATEYLMVKRVEEFASYFEHIKHPSTLELTREDFLSSIRAVGEFFQLPSYVAFHELKTAARTDDTLAKIIDPVERQLERGIAKVIVDAFPVWKGMNPTLELLTDLWFLSMQGLAIAHLKRRRTKRADNLYRFLADEAYRTYLLALKN